MKVPYNYLPYEFNNNKKIIIEWKKLIKTSDFTLGKKMVEFEKKFQFIYKINKTIKVIKFRNIAIILFFGFFISTYADASNLNPRKILDSVDDIYRSNTSHGILTLAVTTTNWQRTLTLEQWSKGKNKHLIKVLKPKKEKDLATLRVDTNVWNYMPKVKKVVKIPSSMMSSSWMGSHFSNDDLVKQSRMVKDYDYSTSFEGIRDGIDIVEITCVPKKNAAVVWGKVEVIVYKEDFIPLRLIYYDEDLNLSRKLEFSNIQIIDNKKIPLKMQMVPENEPGESTTIQWKEIKFNLTISDDFFSLRKLQE